MAGDLVYALAELGVRIGLEAGADAPVGGREGLAAVLAQVVAAGRDAEVDAIPSRTIVCMQSPPLPGCHLRACSWLLMPGTISQESPPSLLRKSDAGSTPHQKSFLPPPASSDQMLAQRPPVVLRKGRGRLRLLELLAEIGRDQDLHAEEGVAARGVVRGRRACRSRPRRRPRLLRRAPAVRTCTGLRRLGDKEALLGSDTENRRVPARSTS